MTGFLKMSEACALGIHAMALIAEAGEERVTTKKLAEFLGASENHLSKVMQRLCRAGMVESSRGPRGGFYLSRPADEIRLGEIYEVMEGRYEAQRCLLKHPVCGGKACVFGGFVRQVNEGFQKYLTETNLSEVKGVLALSRTGENHAAAEKHHTY